MNDKILFEVSIRTRDNDEKFCLGNDIHELTVRKLLYLERENKTWR